MRKVNVSRGKLFKFHTLESWTLSVGGIVEDVWLNKIKKKNTVNICNFFLWKGIELNIFWGSAETDIYFQKNILLDCVTCWISESKEVTYIIT